MVACRGRQRGCIQREDAQGGRGRSPTAVLSPPHSCGHGGCERVKRAPGWRRRGGSWPAWGWGGGLLGGKGLWALPRLPLRDTPSLTVPPSSRPVPPPAIKGNAVPFDAWSMEQTSSALPPGFSQCGPQCPPSFRVPTCHPQASVSCLSGSLSGIGGYIWRGPPGQSLPCGLGRGWGGGLWKGG